MRRIVLRTSALATVLILGVIVIAQAQRGLREEAHAAAPADARGEATSDDGTAGPRLLPASKTLNPLRPGQGQRRFPAEAVAVAATEETSGNALRPRPPATDDKNPAQAPGRPAIDPFAAPRLNAAAAPTAPAMKLSDETPEPPRDLARISDAVGDSPSRPAAAPSPKAAAAPAARQPLLDDRRQPAAPLNARNPEMRAPSEMQAPAAGDRLLSTRTTPASRAGEPGMLREPAVQAVAPRQNAALAEPLPGQALGAPGESRRVELPQTSEGTGKPGNRELEGPQTPQLVLQKLAPAEIQVGKPATFRIQLKNTGNVAAHNVEIHDELPRGTRLVNTNPRASQGVRGELVWSLGTVKPGDEAAVEVQLMPVEEGEIGSVATFTFRADASARAIATRPQLVVKTVAPNKVLIGEEMGLAITISNPGSGIAQKVVLTERVPPGFKHPGGSMLEYDVGDLKPNESRKVELKLTALQAGRVTNLLSAQGEGNLKAEDRLDVEVLAPQLDIAMEGPKRRYLEREATYVVSVSNPGTAPARQVQLIAQLPPGLKFVSANNAGHYEEATRTVQWLLEELPTRESGSVELTTVPVTPGEQTLRVLGSADKGIKIEKEHPVLIEGISAILFEVADTADPIGVGGETTYEIKVVNQGSKAASNVRIAAILPADLKPLAAEGPTRQTIEGNSVVFDPLPTLAPKANTLYRIRVQGLRAGDQRVRVQLTTDEIRVPITKEESTRVFADE